MAACTTHNMIRSPLVVILGATGTGKSKLAVDIAKRFAGEVISADSMQVYKGLDVITNKVTEEEKEGVPHHMMDFIEPWARYTVVDFRNRALPIIRDLQENGKLPIVVGGTNYYIESLVWKVLVEEDGGVGMVTSERPYKEVLDVFLAYRALDHYKEVAEYSQRLFVSLIDQRISLLSETTQPSSSDPLEHDALTIINSINHQEKASADSLARVGDLLKDWLHGLCEAGGAPLPEVELHWDAGDWDDCARLVQLRSRSGFARLVAAADSLTEVLSSLDHGSSIKVLGRMVEETTRRSAPVLQELSRLGQDAPRPFSRETSPEQLHSILAQVDPQMAAALHPNDTRKVVRSLQVCLQKKRKLSSILEEQKAQGSSLGGPLRFLNTAILWLKCDQDVLEKRLDGRVEDMMSRGLLEEVTQFHRQYNASRLETAEQPLVYTQGIFQSIGLKEFHEYLTLPEEQKQTQKGKDLLEQGLAALRQVTKKYARRQDKWVLNRFLKTSDRHVPPVYPLDTSDPAAWTDAVLEPASAVVQSLLGLSPLHPLPKPLPRQPPVHKGDPKQRFYCDTCQRIFIGGLQWDAHLNSSKHRRMVKRSSKVQSLPETT